MLSFSPGIPHTCLFCGIDYAAKRLIFFFMYEQAWCKIEYNHCGCVSWEVGALGGGGGGGDNEKEKHAKQTNKSQHQMILASMLMKLRHIYISQWTQHMPLICAYNIIAEHLHIVKFCGTNGFICACPWKWQTTLGLELPIKNANTANSMCHKTFEMKSMKIYIWHWTISTQNNVCSQFHFLISWHRLNISYHSRLTQFHR